MRTERRVAWGFVFLCVFCFLRLLSPIRGERPCPKGLRRYPDPLICMRDATSFRSKRKEPCPPHRHRPRLHRLHPLHHRRRDESPTRRRRPCWKTKASSSAPTERNFSFNRAPMATPTRRREPSSAMAFFATGLSGNTCGTPLLPRCR